MTKSTLKNRFSADNWKLPDRFPWCATLENKTPAETFLKFLSVLPVMDRSDRNPPITATSVTFTPYLRHAKRTVIGKFQSDLSITCMIDGNFGNISAGIFVFESHVSRKTVVSKTLKIEAEFYMYFDFRLGWTLQSEQTGVQVSPVPKLTVSL